MLTPITEQEFNSLAKQGYNRIPLAVETFADLDTPLSLYLKLANQPFSYLLESCLLYTSPSPRDLSTSRMPSSA